MTDERWESIWEGLQAATWRSLVGDGDEHPDDELAAVVELRPPVEPGDEPEEP